MPSGYRFCYILAVFVFVKILYDIKNNQFLHETGYFLHVEKIRENK